MILFVLVVIAISAGIVWIPARHLSGVTSGGRKALYYTCAMHPWVREHKPGPCPVCGMELTPIYGNENGIAETNSDSNSGTVTLESESIGTINVQTEMAANRPMTRPCCSMAEPPEAIFFRPIRGQSGSDLGRMILR